MTSYILLLLSAIALGLTIIGPAERQTQGLLLAIWIILAAIFTKQKD